MLHKIILLFCAFLCGVFILFANLLATPTSHAFAATKTQLTLNRQQGPLGVMLSLKGKNFAPGQASLSYIDAQGVPGTFVAPSDSSVQVEANGTFATSNVVLPSSGPAGTWKIIVSDSLGTVWSIKYLALAAAGSDMAGAPTLTISPTSGKGGDIIAFSGSNWLPKGTAVNLSLLAGTNSLPLIDTPVVSDKDGAITGTFHLPVNLNLSLVTVAAADVATGALRSQAQISILDSSALPTASPTTLATATSDASATATPVKNGPAGSNGPQGPLPPLSKETWGLLLLVVGGTLGVAAIMLILFLIPWNERKGNVPGSGHY
jgi:hypothetical protein